jgi:hypothetical protein
MPVSRILAVQNLQLNYSGAGPQSHLALSPMHDLSTALGEKRRHVGRLLFEVLPLNAYASTRALQLQRSVQSPVTTAEAAAQSSSGSFL